MERVMVYYRIYSIFHNHNKPDMYRKMLVANIKALSSMDALVWYLTWLEGDGSHSIGEKRGTYKDYPVEEIKNHFYFKRNGVTTYVHKKNHKGEFTGGNMLFGEDMKFVKL